MLLKWKSITGGKLENSQNKYVEVKQDVPEQPVGQRRNQKGN